MSSPDTISVDVDSPSVSNECYSQPSAYRTQIPNTINFLKPLSSAKERRLTTYIDEQLLGIQREYRKREYETSMLRTADAYVEAVRPLLGLVLLIPPVGASSFLRSSLLLRLTGEILDSILGYVPERFQSILSILADLDRGWAAVLRCQTWNAEDKVGESVPGDGGSQSQLKPISQTDRTRLRSLLSAGMDNLEEWIEMIVSNRRGGDPATKLLESLRVQQSFDDLFTETLAELGELHGNVPLDPTDSEHDEYEMV